MPNCLSLAADSTSLHLGNYAEPAAGIGNLERLANDNLPRPPVEVFLHGLAVDQNRAAVIQIKPYFGYGAFSLPGAVVIFLLSLGLYQFITYPWSCSDSDWAPT